MMMFQKIALELNWMLTCWIRFNLCTQFVFRSSPTECWLLFGSDLETNCLTLLVVMKEVFKKSNFKNNQMAKKS